MNDQIVFSAPLANQGPLSEWKIVSTFSTKIQYDKIKVLCLWGLFFFTLCALISYSFIVLISKSMVTRVQKLAQKMNQVAAGDFDLVIDNGAGDEYCDEIGVLTRQFVTMTGQIKDLIGKVTAAQVNVQKLTTAQQKAQFNALQSQINPHFIFNVLECISFSLAKTGETQALNVLQKFAYLMRNSIDFTNQYIPLKQEIKTVTAYMSIQMYRFKEKLQFQTEIDPNTLDCFIPKFAIQPLIENAVCHGVQRKDAGGTVWLKISQSQNHIRITIRDDGVGMSEDTYREVTGSLDVEPDGSQSTSIGLRNIKERLWLAYGDDFDFVIKSTAGKGCSVSISIPKDKDR